MSHSHFNTSNLIELSLLMQKNGAALKEKGLHEIA